MPTRREIGVHGEDLAAAWYQARGYEILDRNWRCPDGEIDLVAMDGEALVFIEVKTRSSTRYGHPFEAITPGKLSRLRRLAAAWLAARGPVRGARRLRIDAIGVLAPRNAPASIEHLEGIF